jgi:hypothetical protein
LATFHMTSTIYRCVIFFGLLLQPLHGGDARADNESGARPEGLPPTFRFIGSYHLNSKLRVERGEMDPVVISPLNYQVFSDGIDLRLYCRVAGEDNYTTYQIYRSDGIGVTRKSGEIDLVAGVQALNTSAEMIRQISVTRNSITMVKMPPRSHRVIITRAIAMNNDDLSSDNR